VDAGFYVFTFFHLPVFRQGLFERLNSASQMTQFNLTRRFLGIDSALAFVSQPTFAPLVRRLKREGVVTHVMYYYSDQYDAYREIKDPTAIRAWDAMLKEDADAVYCASKKIYDAVEPGVKARKPVRIIDHQVDFEHFDYNGIESPAPPPSGEGPIIGYFGSLTDSNDWDIIKYAARERPEWRFVFIGRMLYSDPELDSLPNVQFQGFIPYEELPSHAVHFDVGIMFWRMTDWIKACSPLKLKEYLALGLPVVSVPIDEVVTKYSDYVFVAEDGPGFVEAIERALDSDCKERNRAFASNFSWRAAVDGMVADLGLED
jgi:glycosyltransferase involved in cell wall biosynthesis